MEQKINYDVDYFIKKFEAIPEDKWATGYLKHGDSFCALGHCGVTAEDDFTGVAGYTFTKEAEALRSLLKPLYKKKPEFVVNVINDGFCFSHFGLTPKERILTALKKIKKLNQGTEPSTERRNEVQPELPYVDQTKNFTHLIKVVEETSDLIKETAIRRS